MDLMGRRLAHRPPDVPFKRELVEQRRLIDLPLTHHRFKSPPQGGMNQRSPSASTGVFFNTIGQKTT
jgi:hypothetical protein